MSSAEEYSPRFDHTDAAQAVEKAFTLTLEDLQLFEDEFGGERKAGMRAWVAAHLAVESINRRYPRLKAENPAEFALFSAKRAIDHLAELEELLAWDGTQQDATKIDPISLNTLSFWYHGKELFRAQTQTQTETEDEDKEVA